MRRADVMPLRDHFHPPVSKRHSWEGFHGGWPMVIVQHLMRQLPPRFTAEPRVHLGAYVEVDVGTFENEDATPVDLGSDGTAWQPSGPSLAVETEMLATPEYEVRIYDEARDRRIVATIEIVSPSNKDRPLSRQEFVGKCAALLKRGVSVAIVDLVTARGFNLYADLLEYADSSDPSLGPEPPPTYAAACRWRPHGTKRVLETWSHALPLGQPLPTLPLWLTEEFAVPLDLEATYEETCRALRIG